MTEEIGIEVPVGERVVLRVPGTMPRYGTFVEELGFDNMVRVRIDKEVTKVKKGREHSKTLTPDEIHTYIAHKEDVELLPF